MLRFLLTILAGLFISPLLAQDFPKPVTVSFFEKEMQLFDSLNAVEQADPSAILFTGSSSIRLWASLSLDLSPYPVIRRGFGGSKIEDLHWFLKRIVYPHQPAAIYIYIGSNNVTGQPSDMAEDSVLLYTKAITAVIRNKYPHLPIFWNGINPTPMRFTAMDKIRNLNEKWRIALSSFPQVYFVDTFGAFLDDQGHPRAELYAADRLHLSPLGYTLWAELIKKALALHLKKG
ncbi:MAG: GDSL-type esterase/lipase family protein [Chitinophagaceae bacterium]